MTVGSISLYQFM